MSESEEDFIAWRYQRWLRTTTQIIAGVCDKVTEAAFEAGWHAGRAYSDDLPPWRASE